MTPSTPVPNLSPITPIADGVAILDVSATLPRHPAKRYPKRKKAIRRIYVHHSGASGRGGIDGAIASADYAIDKRDFAGGNYHWWISEDDLFDSDGRELILQMQPIDVVSFHTGGLNHSGVGVALQGNKTRDPLTPGQQHKLDALLSWLLNGQLPSLDPQAPIAWHSVAHLYGGKKKASCPGRYTEAYMREWLHGRALPLPGEEPIA